MQQKY